MKVKTLLNAVLLSSFMFLKSGLLVAQETNSSTSNEKTTYEVGDTGPAGGKIFFDQGYNYGGWRYLEAAPVDTETLLAWSYKFVNIGTSKEIGTGAANTTNIVNSHSSSYNKDTYAAGYCDNLVTDKEGHKLLKGENKKYFYINDKYEAVYFEDKDIIQDWFLPSIEELSLVRQNLYFQNLGSFTINFYWSSSEYGTYLAWDQDMPRGYQLNRGKGSTDSVRCARAFKTN